MKILILVSFLGVVACRKVPLYPRIEELLKAATDVDHLFNETELLISLTEQLMSRSATSGRMQIDGLFNTVDSTLDASYQYSSNYTNGIVSFLINEIETLEISAKNLESCIALVPSLTTLGKTFDDQFKVIFSTAVYIANTTLENKYTALQGYMAIVQGLKLSLSNCNLDEECIVDIANQAEEQSLAFMNGIDDIQTSTPADFDQLLSETNTSALTTENLAEDYICNVASTIENCIRSRIDNPIVTTTPSGQVTTPIPDTSTATTNTAVTPSGDTGETETSPATPVTTVAPSTTLNATIYCSRQRFSLQ